MEPFSTPSPEALSLPCVLTATEFFPRLLQRWDLLHVHGRVRGRAHVHAHGRVHGHDQSGPNELPRYGQTSTREARH